MRTTDDDDTVIPLDHLSLCRLLHLSEITGETMTELAAKIIRDVLEDDARTHATTRH